MNEFQFVASKIPSLRGKLFVITGGNSGVGYWSAYHLASKGASVVIMGRNENKAREAINSIRKDFLGVSISFIKYDQSEPSSIFEAAEALKDIPIDGIVLNAGVYLPKKGAANSLNNSLTFATNALGTNTLFSLLRVTHPQARFVFVTSLVQKKPKDNNYSKYLLPNPKKRYEEYEASKRAVSDICLLGLQDGFNCVLAHPGVAKTEILRDYAPLIKRIGNGFLYLFVHHASKAALVEIISLLDTTPKGSFVIPRGPFGISGFPKIKKEALRDNDHSLKAFRELLNLSLLDPWKIEATDISHRSH